MFSLEALLCHVDDFCQEFEVQWQKKLLTQGGIKRRREKSLSLSEIMTKRNRFSSKSLPGFQVFLFKPSQTILE
jgi:hypothetical protein